MAGNLKGLLVSTVASGAAVAAVLAVLHALEVLELDSAREDLVLGTIFVMVWLVLSAGLFVLLFVPKDARQGKDQDG